MKLISGDQRVRRGFEGNQHPQSLGFQILALIDQHDRKARRDLGTNL
ncbi:hypothetical protein ACVDG5_010840 [Mesorhizobium sp. ORM6]